MLGCTHRNAHLFHMQWIRQSAFEQFKIAEDDGDRCSVLMGHINDEIRLYLVNDLEFSVGILQLLCFPLQVMIKPHSFDTDGNVSGEYGQYAQVEFIQRTGSAFIVGVENPDNAIAHFERNTNEGFGRVASVAPDFRKLLLSLNILYQKRFPRLSDRT